MSTPKILFFSHDSFGLGHLRRTMTLATELVRRVPGAQVLIASGSPCATQFDVPRGIDVIKLPSAGKNSGGAYVSRSLACDLDALVRLRRGIMLELLSSFSPDLFVVDHKVLGLGGELSDVLPRAKALGIRTILGLRDIIDAPETVAREWSHPRVRQALAQEYDRVCVYGSPDVFDVRVEYPVPPELSERVEFVGYVVRQDGPGRAPVVPSLRPEVLVTVGGGEDGAERIETYLDALETTAGVPWDSTIVLGPLLESSRARRIKRRARLLDGVTVHRFHADMPQLLRRASAVVGMAGYNTVTELMQARTATVLCPRSFPRREQLIRAERLQGLGLADCLPHPEPAALLRAVEGALQRGSMRGPIPPLDGHARLCDVALELLADRAAAKRTHSASAQR